MKLREMGSIFGAGVMFGFLLFPVYADAQVTYFSKENLIEYSPEWTGERFPDGRPKVSDNVLERMKTVTIEEAWVVLRHNGYPNQFEGDWKTSHSNPVLVGRAVTGLFLPYRPDIDKVIRAKGENTGYVSNFQSWIIDTMVDGDVLVVDIMGRIIDAPIFGDVLGTSIYTKGGKGVVFDGGARDLEAIRKNLPPDFEVFVRGWDPSSNPATGKMGMMGMGMNLPINIGRAMVMPGDVILAKEEGVIFIPPHLALEVVETSEIVQIWERFGQQRLREGVYVPGQVDAKKWSNEIKEDFFGWAEKQGIKITSHQKELLFRERTW